MLFRSTAAETSTLRAPGAAYSFGHLAQGLKERLEELMPVAQAELKTFKKEHGSKIVDKVTIDQLLGGARSIKCMLWETSLLDPLEVADPLPLLTPPLPLLSRTGEEAPWKPRIAAHLDRHHPPAAALGCCPMAAGGLVLRRARRASSSAVTAVDTTKRAIGGAVG